MVRPLQGRRCLLERLYVWLYVAHRVQTAMPQRSNSGKIDALDQTSVPCHGGTDAWVDV